MSSLSCRLSAASSWKEFVSSHRGRSYLAPDLDHIAHSARPLLQKLRDHGARVPLDDQPWNAATIERCAERGPHPSANLHRDFLRDEMADFINAGFWVVLPLRQVRALGKDMRLSPLAVKDEVNRRPHMVWYQQTHHQ